MNPQVVAAIIAASVSGLTLIGTVVAQILGHRATRRDTERALDRTLKEQREQLDRTLAEQRTRTLNERFAAAADQLGSDRPPAVRLAGVYAMAGLADDWEANRQICVDVLCAYLRMPYEPDPGEDAPGPEQLAFSSSREVRHTVIRAITAHLRKSAVVSWQGLDFDFTGAVFDGGDFSEAVVSGGTIRFVGAKFCGWAEFHGAEFLGGRVRFNGAEFSGHNISFDQARFCGGDVHFTAAEFSDGEVCFAGAEFSGGETDFSGAKFCGSAVTFHWAKYRNGGNVRFVGAEFADGQADFAGGEFSGGRVDFSVAKFSGATVRLEPLEDWSVPAVGLPQDAPGLTYPPAPHGPQKLREITVWPGQRPRRPSRFGAVGLAMLPGESHDQ